jgi:hypothetical protein
VTKYYNIEIKYENIRCDDWYNLSSVMHNLKFIYGITNNGIYVENQ